LEIIGVFEEMRMEFRGIGWNLAEFAEMDEAEKRD